MFSALLAIPASIPTTGLTLGDGIVWALLVPLLISIVALGHAAVTARRDGEPSAAPRPRFAHLPRPLAQDQQVRPIAA